MGRGGERMSWWYGWGGVLGGEVGIEGAVEVDAFGLFVNDDGGHFGCGSSWKCVEQASWIFPLIRSCFIVLDMSRK